MGTNISRGLKSNIRRGLGSSGTPFPVSTSNTVAGLGRVTRVVLSKDFCTEEEWDLYQRSQALYGVFYKELQIDKNGQVAETGIEKFAFCPQINLHRIPVKNEIVKLKADMAPDLSTQNGNILQQKVYWTEILPAWNHPHLNMVPDLQKENVEEDDHFIDQGNDVNPLQLCPGDVSIEGRHGESLRFGGTWLEGSPIAVEDLNGKPYAILRVGQGVDNDGEGDRAVYEDVNKDLASIYFTTEHIIPLDQAFNRRNSWRDRKVMEAKNYNKPQILLTSDRIWLNGRDDIELSAKNFVGVTADQVNIDGQSQVSLDADKIYLGNKAVAKDTTVNGVAIKSEPVLKGATTTKMIADLVDQFIILLDSIVKAGQGGSGDPGAFIGVMESVSKTLLETLKTYKDQLPTLHSKKVFTE